LFGSICILHCCRLHLICSLTTSLPSVPTGSTTAAIIYLLHLITILLSTNLYVIVISLDFSKTFDTVRHSALLNKIAQLDLPDHIYNWLVNFFTGHSHCTSFSDQTSEFENINANIIHGSAIVPAAYVVNAGDLKAVTPGNFLCKYSDDTYLIVPASNEASFYTVSTKKLYP